MRYSRCRRCGRRIHLDDQGKYARPWFDEDGSLCKIPNPFRRSHHDPEEDMRSYTEDEIRTAVARLQMFGRADYSGDSLLGKLAELKGTPVLADADTVTAKEMRDAWKRIDSLTGSGSVTAEQILRDISEHREPEHIPGRIYRSTPLGTRYLCTGRGTFRALGGEVSRKAISGTLAEEVP